MSLRRIVTGTALVSSASLTRLLAQFIAVPILSRLLTSTDYGLVAIASPLILFSMLITDAGLGMSLVRSTPLKDETAWSTSFWVIFSLGGAIVPILVLLSPLVAYTFGEPKLKLIVTTLSLIIAAQAAAVIPGAALQQARQFSTIAAIEISSTVLGVATAVTAAFMGAGVWALVAQQITFFFTRLLVTFVCSPFRPRLVFDLAAIKHHLVFGRDVLSTNLIAQLSGSVDNLALGGVLGPTSVGFYTIAMQFIRLPTMVITGPMQYVLYSHLATVKENLPAIRRTFLLATRVLSVLVVPSMSLVAAAHHSIFKILLSEKWAQSGTIFMILAAAGAIQAMMALGGDIMLVLGRPDLRLRMTIEFSLIWLGALLLSLLLSHDIHWVAGAYTFAVLLYVPRTLSLVLSLLQCRFATYLETLVVPALITPIAILVYSEVNRTFALQKFADVGLCALLAFATMVVCVLVQRRSFIDESALLSLPFGSTPAVQKQS
ncbi:lipopolysaccharide biosynthesis protein [Bradyrhizobium sp.]|uniref:lipopolysaccharide biosynthesis protein n=1 Tax=Bradyrhizobium sp. TaxID=376 RepID=UPI001D3F4D07|nr:lipopolysaccharide biosynthesis protein [Bradyrhizobium sp.]MBV8701944.1 lipopolysaccharide biosynthesis protein [Bradyrhizobium sp.]MBV9983507.1 lipopolysaccharide biosynthesis protein [Bradyrhizobium sp.]